MQELHPGDPESEVLMEWRIMTTEEQAEFDAQETSPEVIARELWAEKHPRCEECGQFLKKRVHKDSLLFPDTFPASDWIGHFVQDYFGEWDHV